MSKYLIFIPILLFSLGFSQQEYNNKDIIELDNGLWSEKFSDVPITGKVYGYFGEQSNPKKVYLGNIRNGKKEGKWVFYFHSTGRKKYEENYKDGKYDGLETNWYENGQKRDEGTYKDGKFDGQYTFWYENGQKEGETTYKDGELDGLLTFWYENGQKEAEINYKDGKHHRSYTKWYENGQKKEEGNYKDDKLISKKEWNEDGSIKE